MNEVVVVARRERERGEIELFEENRKIEKRRKYILYQFDNK